MTGAAAARALTLSVLSLAGTLVSPAQAQAPSAPGARATTVEGVTVSARRIRSVEGINVHVDWCPTRPRGQASGPPRVTTSSPRQGEVVPPGPVILSLTFDQSMNCGWAMTYRSGEHVCSQIGEWDLPGRRTWRMRCALTPGQAWSMRFDAVKGHGFASLAGQAAAPFTLGFQTAVGPTPGSVGEPEPELARGARLACPEHRLRGAGPRCRVVRDPAETPAAVQAR